MAKILELPSFKDDRGILTVIEKTLPFSIKRVYYIYDTNDLSRGGHGHRTGQQALICLHKTCMIQVRSEDLFQNFSLCHPQQCLQLDSHEWHSITFEKNAILLILASEYYDKDNYIYD